MKKPWKEKWEIIRDLSSGGQGYTFLVTRLGQAGGESFVLKTLKDQKSAERRARMFHEVAALRTLEHAGISKYIDSNAEHFKSSDDQLYLVTEYVRGNELSSVAKNPLPVEIARGCVLRILDILDYCHRRDVLHRDIKPSNIIFRNGSPADPVLLDFGLSFCAALRDPDFVTPESQHIGNRFIMLPEYHTKEADKRTAISDIAQCVGILFFLITGLPPESLLDQNGLKPHQRPAAAQILEMLPGNSRGRLARIFETGFSPESDRRWRSIASLRDEVDSLSESTAPVRPPDYSAWLKTIGDALGSDRSHSRLARAEIAIREFFQTIHNAMPPLHQATATRVSGSMQTSTITAETGCASATISFYDRFRPKHPLALQITFALEDVELVVYGKVDGVTSETGRVGVFDPEAEMRIKTFVEATILEALERWLPISR